MITFRFTCIGLLIGLLSFQTHAALVSLRATEDTTITEHGGLGGPDSNHGSDTAMRAIGSATFRSIPMLKFDVSDYAGQTVDSDAVLYVYIRSVHPTFQTEFKNISLYRWDSLVWNESTVTFNQVSFGDDPLSLPSDLLLPAMGTVAVNNAHINTYITFTIPKEIIQQWIDDPSINNGLALVNERQTHEHDVTFSTREYAVGKRPALQFDVDGALQISGESSLGELLASTMRIIDLTAGDSVTLISSNPEILLLSPDCQSSSPSPTEILDLVNVENSIESFCIHGVKPGASVITALTSDLRVVDFPVTVEPLVLKIEGIEDKYLPRASDDSFWVSFSHASHDSGHRHFVSPLASGGGFDYELVVDKKKIAKLQDPEFRAKKRVLKGSVKALEDSLKVFRLHPQSAGETTLYASSPNTPRIRDDLVFVDILVSASDLPYAELLDVISLASGLKGNERSALKNVVTSSDRYYGRQDYLAALDDMNFFIALVLPRYESSLQPGDFNQMSILSGIIRATLRSL